MPKTGTRQLDKALRNQGLDESGQGPLYSDNVQQVALIEDWTVAAPMPIQRAAYVTVVVPAGGVGVVQGIRFRGVGGQRWRVTSLRNYDAGTVDEIYVAMNPPDVFTQTTQQFTAAFADFGFWNDDIDGNRYNGSQWPAKVDIYNGTFPSFGSLSGLQLRADEMLDPAALAVLNSVREFYVWSANTNATFRFNLGWVEEA